MIEDWSRDLKIMMVCIIVFGTLFMVGVFIENENNKKREHAIEMLKMGVIEKCATNGGKDAK